jgi:hypothetical protein
MGRSDLKHSQESLWSLDKVDHAHETQLGKAVELYEQSQIPRFRDKLDPTPYASQSQFAEFGDAHVTLSGKDGILTQRIPHLFKHLRRFSPSVSLKMRLSPSTARRSLSK